MSYTTGNALSMEDLQSMSKPSSGGGLSDGLLSKASCLPRWMRNARGLALGCIGLGILVTVVVSVIISTMATAPPPPPPPPAPPPPPTPTCGHNVTTKLTELWTDHVISEPLGAHKAITFTVQAESDAQIIFMQGRPKKADRLDPYGRVTWTHPRHYQLTLGKLMNTQTEIYSKSVDTTGLLSKTKPRQFWASALQGQLAVGVGDTVGKQLILEWSIPNQNADPFKPTHVAVATTGLGLFLVNGTLRQQENLKSGSTGQWSVCIVRGSPGKKPAISPPPPPPPPPLPSRNNTIAVPATDFKGSCWNDRDDRRVTSSTIELRTGGCYAWVELQNLKPMQLYEVRFTMVCTLCQTDGDEMLNVKIDGVEEWESDHPNYQPTSEVLLFTAYQPTVVLRFENDATNSNGGGANTSPKIEISAVTLKPESQVSRAIPVSNPGFEMGCKRAMLKKTAESTACEPARWTGCPSGSTSVPQCVRLVKQRQRSYSGITSGSGDYFAEVVAPGTSANGVMRSSSLASKLKPGKEYFVHFLAARRPDRANAQGKQHAFKLQVKYNDQVIWERIGHMLDDRSFKRYSAVFKSASAASQQITFEVQLPPGDTRKHGSALIDNVGIFMLK